MRQLRSLETLPRGARHVAEFVRAMNPLVGPASAVTSAGDLHIERRRVQVGTAYIYYQVAGVGAPLILVHGLSGSGRWWARNIPGLARHFQVYIVDLIGFGQSRGPRPVSLGEAAPCLIAMLDQLGLDRTTIVGHSMGGFIAASLAAAHPDRIDKLVLVNAAVLPFERGYLHHALDLVRALARLPFGFLPLLIADAWRAGPVAIWNAARELLTTGAWPELAQIQVPTLVVWGEHDQLLPLELGQRLGAEVPGAKLVVLEGAGHIAMWDRPEAFNLAITEFLSTGPRAG